jgi:hypothetical protein
MKQPDFDFGTEAALVEGISNVPLEGEPTSRRVKPVMAASAGSELPLSTWKEVPQALFLSWPVRRQLAYCAARDEDAALHALSDEWRQFYLERAEYYDRTTD